MCGIFGFASSNQRHRAIPLKISSLGLRNEVRGGHACGLGNSAHYLKGPFRVPEMVCNPAFSGIVTEKPIVLGHTRFGTTGDNTARNAHPFYTYGADVDGHCGEQMFGMHNGIISNHVALAKEFNVGEYKTDYEVDSEAVIKALRNTENDYAKVLSKMGGQAALAWVWRAELYLYRDSNPLFVGLDAKGDLYFSSIESSLEEIGCVGIESLERDFVFKMTGDGLQKVSERIVSKPTYSYSSGGYYAGGNSHTKYPTQKRVWNQQLNRYDWVDDDKDFGFDADGYDSWGRYDSRKDSGKYLASQHDKRPYKHPKDLYETEGDANKVLGGTASTAITQVLENKPDTVKTMGGTVHPIDHKTTDVMVQNKDTGLWEKQNEAKPEAHPFEDDAEEAMTVLDALIDDLMYNLEASPADILMILDMHIPGLAAKVRAEDKDYWNNCFSKLRSINPFKAAEIKVERKPLTENAGR